jgi:hypothetical protein
LHINKVTILFEEEHKIFFKPGIQSLEDHLRELEKDYLYVRQEHLLEKAKIILVEEIKARINKITKKHCS